MMECKVETPTNVQKLPSGWAQEINNTPKTAKTHNATKTRDFQYFQNTKKQNTEHQKPKTRQNTPPSPGNRKQDVYEFSTL